jgi:O-antigen ligase
MKPYSIKSRYVSNSPDQIMSFSIVTKSIIAAYIISISYSQWYYAGIQEGTLTSVVPKNLTSILFVSIVLILVSLLERLNHAIFTPKSSSSTLIVVASYFFLVSTFLSVIIGVWHSGLNFDSLEGVKSIFATLSGLVLVRHFSSDLLFYLRLYAYIFSSIVIFSIIQVIIGIDWSTRNSFFTVGAESRWWELSSAWGPFALSGKNVFGIILILSFSLLAPITFLTKMFKRFDRIYFSVILMMDIFLILLSKSRTSIILILLNIIVLALFYTAYSKNPIPLTFSILLIPLVSGFYFYWNTSWILSNQSAIARRDSLAASLMAPDSNFLFGTGYNSIFQLTASTFGKSLSQAGTRGINVDNYFVRRFLEGGLLGLVSLLGILTCLVYLFIIRENLGRQSRAWGICAGLLFIDITLASSSGDFLSFQLVNCFFFLILSFIAAAFSSSKP